MSTDKVINPPRVDGTYRGIRYRVNSIGIGSFDDFLPGSALRWGSWSRFIADDEHKSFDDSSPEVQEQIMRKAIDRAHADNPCYTGDIRFRGH